MTSPPRSIRMVHFCERLGARRSRSRDALSVTAPCCRACRGRSERSGSSWWDSCAGCRGHKGPFSVSYAARDFWFMPDLRDSLVDMGKRCLRRRDAEGLCACQANIDLTIDVPPLLGLAEPPYQLVEGAGVLGSVLEPRKEIEWFTQVATVVQTPRDGRQILETDADVPRSVLEDGTSFVLRQRPPRVRFADRNQGGPCRMRTAEAFLPGVEGVELLPLRVASIARDPAQHPGRRPWIAAALEHREPLRGGQPGADDSLDPVDAPHP